MSLIVVWRRWAFLGEGIAHAGFGGAGTAWFLAALIPALDSPAIVTTCIIAFCLFSAYSIGALHRRERVQSDTAIGAWLVGALAWGFLGQQVYFSAHHVAPAGFEALLFGQTELLTWTHAQLSAALACFCLVILITFRRAILLYCLEPTLAEVEGIPAGRYHYLLILLIGLTIMLGVRLVGSVLVTALLILPGATAMLLSRRLTATIAIAAGAATLAAIIGILVSARWPALPQGPLIVLSLFVMFILAWQIARRNG
jgi:manganese/zinc/iron transport system permease protein